MNKPLANVQMCNEPQLRPGTVSNVALELLELATSCWEGGYHDSFLVLVRLATDDSTTISAAAACDGKAGPKGDMSLILYVISY